jgi:hypothetical protein
MSARIMSRMVAGNYGNKAEVFDIYSADFREVIDTKPTMEAALEFLRLEARQSTECASCEE